MPAIRFKLIGAAVGRPRAYGGFDMRKHKPKPMRKAVPAGSVYFFRLLDVSLADVFDELSEAFHGKQIADGRHCDLEDGWGITLLGGKR